MHHCSDTFSDLSIINGRPSVLDGPSHLHHLVQLSSDVPAVDFLENGTKRRTLSYETLHALSNALASNITQLSAKLQSASPVVPVLIPQCPELYVVLLAVLKAGKAFCPLLLDTPTERLRFILEDISADFVITLSPYSEKLRSKTGLHAVSADHEFSHVHAGSILSPVSTQDLAYVLYTSGSTGLPKAVKVSHRAVTQSILAHDRHLPGFTRFLQFAAPTFDVSIFEIFFPWFRGRTLVGCTRTQMLDNLPRLINNLEVDAAELTPTVASSLLHGRSSVPRLKLLLTIGEMLTQYVIDEFGGDDRTESVLWAMYGPTEAAIHCTLQPRLSSQSTIGNIGFPLDTVSAYIIAPSVGHSPVDFRILPTGEVGELAIGGWQVADGYLNRPELTASAFIDHPMYGRIYRTGDRARLGRDGCLECLGRVTVGQVKLRGQRVELGEIEQVILKIDGCRTVAVMILNDRLVAFCATTSEIISRSDVINYCKDWLPSFMIPSDVCFLQSVPQLPSGKIDRTLLKAQYRPTLTNGTPTSALEDPTEDMILRILENYTEGSLALHTPLVTIGLDSLQSIRLASALRRQGFMLSAMDIVTTSTVAELIANCKACLLADNENTTDESTPASGSLTPHTTESSDGTHTSEDTHPALDVFTVHSACTSKDLCDSDGARNSDVPHTKNEPLRSDLDSLSNGNVVPKLSTNDGLRDAVKSHPHQPHIQALHTHPCTSLQEAMLAESLARPGTYWNWIEVEIPFPCTFIEVRDGLLLVCRNNEILRTGFVPATDRAGTYVQIVREQLPPSQIRQVSEFHRFQSPSTDATLLYPLSIDIRTYLSTTRIYFRLHHAIYDGWSFDILLQDIFRCLRKKRLAPRPQFRDVSQYLSHGISRHERFQDNRYWTNLLRDFVPTILPNYNGKIVRETSLERFSHQSQIKTRSLIERSRDLRVSPQVYFQAATALVLARYSGSRNVTFGNVVSGRTIPVTGVEEIMGPCIASIPCSMDLTDILQVQDLLQVTHKQNQNSLRHSAYPLREITKAAGVEPGTHLFDVLFVWQQSLTQPEDSALFPKIIDSADDSEMKLTLEFEPCQDFVSFRATYNPATIPERQIKYLSGQIDEIVSLFLSDLTCMVSAIDCCFSTSSLSIINPVPSQDSPRHGLSHAVEEWAIINPGKEAVRVGHVMNGVMQVKESITYATLNTRANQLAHSLSSYITKEDQLIGIILDKSVNLYVSILAVLKLGHGYLPLVPGTPAERIDTILRDAQITLCLSDSTLVESLPRCASLRLVEVDLLDLGRWPNTNLGTIYQGEHLAYAVFTSGSTGTPKGVLVTQDNLMSNLHYLSTIYPYSAGSRMLQACSQAFDVSVFEIFFSWHVGICLCTARKDDLFRDFEASIRCLQITHLSLTPTVAALVEPNNVPNVELLVTAGEALTEHVRRKWADHGLYQGYGPSETTNICTVRTSVGEDDLINNIGFPFENTSAFVLDPESDRILPRGAVGELCFGGAQVFRGYLNKPELNSMKLIDHPIYGRIYRSGDMGVMLPDNAILSMGRSDDQVKIRGQRVELGEINSVVLDAPEVRDCVTMLLSSHNGTTTLVSFWVPIGATNETFRLADAKIHEATISKAFETLSSKLPSYMVPLHLIPISYLPMTAQAKIDKRVLQATFKNMTEGKLTECSTYQALSETNLRLSEWEESVASILSTVLALPISETRRETSFFSLGLDSVSAIRFCNELRRARLGDFSVTTVLKNSSMSRLSKIKNGHGGRGERSKRLTVDLTHAFQRDQTSAIVTDFQDRGLSISRILPCTPLQEAMLSGESTKSGAAYCNVMIFEVNGNLEQLQEAWNMMILRHEILRTAFVPTDHPSYAFAQVVLEPTMSRWQSIPLSEDVQPHMASIVTNSLNSREPPIHLAFRHEGTTTKLLFGCHHAMYDGSAIAILLEEVQLLYRGNVLPPYVSCDAYLQYMMSQDLNEADRYWSESFSGFEPTLFPNLTGKSNRSAGLSKSVSRCLHLPLSEARQACQDASTSLLSVVHATWVKILHFYTGEDDVCFGNVVSGRNFPEAGLDSLVAPCFNTLPVRVKFDAHRPNSALIQLTHLINIEMLAFQLTPLRRIQAKVLPNGNRLFDTLVILQQPAIALDASIWSLEKEFGEMDLPVVCEILQDGPADFLKLVLHYNTSLMSEIDATTVGETFDQIFTTLLTSPQAAVDDNQGLSEHLRAEQNLAFQSRDTGGSFLHSGFERMADANPNHIALDFVHPDGTRTIWSFGTLNDRANAIAQTLIDHDVVPESIVPLHLAKSPDFYASVLGVLKAGAAFAPVHPDLPQARKRVMLDELKPRLLLCSKVSAFQREGTVSISVNSVGSSSLANAVVHGLKTSSLAYCLFTSGSTGAPKAVSMEHGAPMQTIESSRSLVPWSSSSRLLQYAAVTFDMCYFDCFLAWTLGFTLCAAEQADFLNDLPNVINTLGVDLLDLTPSVAVSLRKSEVPSVKWLYCIGEAMSSDVVKEWSNMCVNSYGPTEAAFCTTIFQVADDISTSVIGKPFPSTSFAVFTPNGHGPLPVLSIGELYIGGAQLARGYLGKPELTSERFVDAEGQRFYKSGDLVRMLSGGNFEFVGRTDDQVKIRGLRVELGEINHALVSALSNVKTVVTQILKKDAAAKEQLVSFVVRQEPVTEAEEPVGKRELKEVANRYLPSYMVPNFFIFVEKIPLSMASKVDKKALEAIFRSQNHEDALNKSDYGYDKLHQWTVLEDRVRTVLSNLSKTPIEEIRPATTIYQLGLDSISAVQIAAALRKEGHRVTAADVMRYMSCEDIAAHMVQGSSKEVVATAHFDFETFHEQHIGSVLQTYGIGPSDISTVRPCTALQKGMLSQFLATEGSVYMNYLRLELDHNVDISRLKVAWDVTMDRHEMLRTGFAHTKDIQHPFVMVTYKSATLPWVVTSGLDHLNGFELWIRQQQQHALTRLHIPPWALRVCQASGDTYVDLAIFHAIFDAQSLQSILDDVVSAYWGQPSQAPAALEPAIDTILSLNHEKKEERMTFWSEMGKNASSSRFPNLSPLRQDPMPPKICTQQSTHVLADLEQGCMRGNITLQAAGISSWLSLLSAYTGETSVTCGVVLSGRAFDAAENTVFPSINTVPLTCAVSTDRRTLLQTVMSLNALVQQHQHTPLGEIQKLMGHPSEPLFDTIFAFQKLPNQGIVPKLWNIVDERATIEYPVSIEIEPKNEHLEYRLTFLPHIIPEQQARLILDQLDHLMEIFIYSSGPSIAESDPSLYSVTTAKEPTLPSEVRLLHEFVEQTATKSPHRVALEFAHSIQDGKHSARSWTYAELDAEGNRIAHLLISRGVQPGALVGICFEKCPEASFATLGILKAGCAFVAIDPSAPAARQAFVIKDSDARAVLSMSKQSAQFEKGVEAPVLNLDEITTVSFPKERPVLAQEVSSQDRSYCLYTSGTTGTPKGCELTHENAVQAMLSFQRLFANHWDSKSRWLQFASFHFDVSVLEQFWSWSVGICVVSAPRDAIFEDLANSINALGITHIDLTPSLAQILHPDDVPSLCKGVFITGGESLKQEILDVWGPKAVIYNGYGPTEATIGCTMYPRVPANGKPSNIGWQFDNVGSLVLKSGTDEPVLRGGVGELCVTGKLVGKGYLNRPDLNAEKFPYIERFDERVYRTGDFVRILYDGTFDFLGRADDQVKLRGQRLEVGEINSVIRQSSSEIADVATLVLKHPKQQKEQLVSFLVLGRQANRQPEVLFNDAEKLSIAKEICHDRLPPFMVPTHFVSITSMPLNMNNKADGKRLKELFQALSTGDLQTLSATASLKDDVWTKVEQEIRQVLSKTLGVSEADISKDHSLFELGMDSISVISVSRAMKQTDLVKASASLIMRYSTVRRLAKALGNANNTGDDRGSILVAQQAIAAVQHRHRRSVARALSIDTSAIEAIAPCTPLQQGMIAKYLDSDSGLYFNTFQFKLSDSVDAKRLQEAWSRVSEWAQILRTVFINTEDGYVQVALRGNTLSWSSHTIATDSITTEKFVELRRAWLSNNQNQLTQPVELHLLTSTSEQSLVVHIFHGLYDGNSIELIFNAVWQTYNAEELIDDAPAFHTALAYGPLRAMPGAKEFWQSHLARVSYSPLPTTSNDTAHIGRPVTSKRTLENLEAFDSVRRRLNVTAQAIVQACWLNVLEEHTTAAVTTGLVVSGRSIDLEGADGIIGPLFNTIPYHQRVQGNESWALMIKKVHAFNIAAHPYQHTPLRDIMKWSKRSADQPLFDTLFVYEVAQEEEDWSRNDAWVIEDGEAMADYPLALEIEQRSKDTLNLTLITQGHVVDGQASRMLLDSFEQRLRQLLADPDIKVGLSAGMDQESYRDDEKQETQTSNVSHATDFEWTATATNLREEVANLSGVDVADVSAATSIFELGLDSIDAIKLSSKLKKQGVDLTVSGIMRGLTIARMMQGLAQTDPHAQDAFSSLHFEEQKRVLRRYLQQRNVDTAGIEDVLPPTPLQEAMVAEMVASEYSRYYNFDVLKLGHGTVIESLRGAWLQVVEASPILRTGFVEVDDPAIDFTFAQIVQRQSHDFWSHVRIESDPDFTNVLDELRVEAVRIPLSTPAFRITFIEAPRQSYLVLAIAHALYDGWSLSLVHSDVNDAYHDLLNRRPSYDFVLSSILSTSGADAAGFWRDYLHDAEPSVFPRRSECEKLLVHRHEQASAISLSKVNLFAKENNVPLQTIGQAVFAMVLASYIKSLDVTFGSVLSGRDDEETAQLMFPTMNTVTIRTILHGTSIDMLQYVQENFVSIKEWQHFPLRKALSLPGVNGRLFESLFIYQKTLQGTSSEIENLYASIEGRSDVEYPVCVEMETVGEQLVWRCAVKDDVFSNDGARQILNRLDTVLAHMTQNSDAPVISIAENGISICGLPTFKRSNPGAIESRSDANKDANKDAKKDANGIAPELHTIRTITEVLAKVSKTSEDDITSDMTIFHMGLDSISAIKVSSLLRREGISLGVGEMLRAGTVHQMANIVASRVIDTDQNGEDYRSIISEALQDLQQAAVLDQANISADTVAEILPVSAGQLYMISMWLNTDGGNFYPDFHYDLDGYITLETLQDSWSALTQANPILRTVFVPTQNDHIPYLQVVLHATTSPIVDITDLEDDDLQDTVATTASEQPWAQLFVTQRQDGWDVALRIHHSLYDGVSLPLLMQQFKHICNGVATRSSTDAFANLVASGHTKSVLSERKAFWIRYLSDASSSNLRQPSKTPTAKTEVFRPALLPTSNIEALARKQGVSTQALFLASYAKLYAKTTGIASNRDVIIGIYLANRSLPIEDLVSATIPTVNLVPLRVALPLQVGIFTMAVAIQLDLQSISSPTNAMTSLYEINEWTGIKIDTFVNFITLPIEEDDDDELYRSHMHIGLKVKKQWQEEISQISYTETDNGGGQRGLLNERVNGAYLHAIDVEATMRNGALDVGVFAPTEMLSLGDGEALIKSIRRELERA